MRKGLTWVDELIPKENIEVLALFYVFDFITI